jgi:hypothetical protein
MPDEAGLWKRIDRRGPDECWPWIGRCLTRDGYATFHLIGRKNTTAHRVVYELLVGPIPEGLDIDHLCRNRQCMNPAHMEPVTRRVNTLRGETMPAKHAAVTHCPYGHEYTPENTRWYDGHRWCRACGKRRSVEAAERKKAARHARAESRPHIWYWRSKLPDRKGERCRVLTHGRMNSILVEFERDGYRVITSRHAVRYDKTIGALNP